MFLIKALPIAPIALWVGLSAVFAQDPTFFPKQRTVWVPRGTAQLLKPYLPKPQGATNDYRLIIETPDCLSFVAVEKQMGNPPDEVKAEPGETRNGVRYTRHVLTYGTYPGAGFELSLCWQDDRGATLSYQAAIRAGGTFDWRRLTAKVTPPQGAARLALLLIKWQQRGISGTFWVDNVVLREDGGDKNLLRAGTFDEQEWKSPILQTEGKDGGLCAKFVCPPEKAEQQQALWMDPERKPTAVEPGKTYVAELDLKTENLGSATERPIAALLFRAEESAPEGKGTIFTQVAGAGGPPSAPEATELIVLPPLKDVRPKEARIAPCMYGMMFSNPDVARSYAENAWRSGITWTYGSVQNNVVSILWPRGHRVWLAKPGEPFGVVGKARDILEQRKDVAAVGFDGKPRTHLFCPEWLLSPDGAEARRIMDDALVEQVNRDGYTAVNWDIEQPVLEPPEKGFCFCARCLAAFRAQANLPADAALDGKTILEKYRDAWIAFRCRQNAELVRLCRESLKSAARRTQRPIEFSVYSGYQCPKTLIHYGVDWKLLAPHLDLGIAGYGGSREAIRATVDALNGVPFIGGEMCYLSPTNDERPAPNPYTWRNRLLRQFVESGGCGVLIWYLPTMDGAAFYYTSEAAEIIAAHEDIFRKGKRCDEAFTVRGLKPEHWAALERDRARLLLLFNFTKDAVTVAVEQRGVEEGWKAQLHGKPGDLPIDPKRFDHTLDPWGTAVIVFR
ncbi:MAG: hypothetical protein AB1696_07010 [Planctomycetota bacterium]